MIDLYHGDCLELMKQIPDKSIDLVLTDTPYGTTACKWDNVIPFEPMWNQIKRIRKEKAAVVLFGSEPFSSHLRLSNIKNFKYDWVWRKQTSTGFLQSKFQPLKSHEMISCFFTANYYPQKTTGHKPTNKAKGNGHSPTFGKSKIRDYKGGETTRYPKSVIDSKNERGFHPTQKPVDLLEYLIKTYTLEGDTVLDFTMGSGSTGVAAKKLKRNFIGIEKDEKYFQIAKKRIENGESCYQQDLL